jgi:hypothetical protein
MLIQATTAALILAALIGSRTASLGALVLWMLAIKVSS